MAPEVKFFQVRDRMTNIPVMCVRFDPQKVEDGFESMILLRAGWGSDSGPAVYYVKIAGGESMAQYNFTDWRDRSNAYAHRYIEEHWAELQSGQVVDVRVIAGEAEEPAEFEC